jgi:hypothetical protein
MAKNTQVSSRVIVKTPTPGNDSTSLGDNTVSTSKIQDLAVTSNKIQLSPTITTPTIVTNATVPLVIGGSTASSSLILESTSGAGTSDSILFKTGSQATRMTIDTSGNVGVGTTPSAWAPTVSPAIEMEKIALWTGGSSGGLGHVAYYNGTNWIYKSSSLAPADINMSSGTLTFRNAPVGILGNPITYTTRFHIDLNGNVCLGTILEPYYTAGRTSLTIEGTTTNPPSLKLGNFTGGAGVSLGSVDWYNRDNTSSSTLRTSYIYSSVEGSTANNRGSIIGFATKADGVSGGGTTRMTIDNAGNVGIGVTPTARNNTSLQIVNGIGFPATQVASTDVNTLDDYEEGTWTPVVTASSGSITSYTASGKYTKIGNIVVAQVAISITNNGTGAGAIDVSVPFNATSAIYVGSGRENALTGNQLQVYINVSSIRVQTYNNAYPGGTGASIFFTLTYLV